MIDDAELMPESGSTSDLEAVLRGTRERPLRVIAAGESRALQRAYGGWLTELRRQERGLLLDPDHDIDGDLLGVRLPRRDDRVVPPGRGYLVTDGSPRLVQVATDEAIP